MACVIRSLKTEWIPIVGYMTVQEAHRDIGHCLMSRYNWIRWHKFNDGLAQFRPRKNLKPCPALVDHYILACLPTQW